MEDSQLARWIYFGVAAYLIAGTICLIYIMDKIKLILTILEKINKHQILTSPVDPTLKAINDIYEAGRR
jgi:hypothetical protein